MEISRILFLFVTLISLNIKATTESVVAFFPDKDPKTIFQSAVPKLNLSDIYTENFKQPLDYDQQSFLLNDNLDQYEKQISDYLSKKPTSHIFVAIGIGRYMVNYSFQQLNFFSKLCPISFHELNTEMDLEKLLSVYRLKLLVLKNNIESKYPSHISFIYLGGQIRPEFFEDKKGFCSSLIDNTNMKSFYSADIIRALSKQIPIVYSPLFSASLANYYQNNGTTDDLNKKYFNMLIPYIN